MDIRKLKKHADSNKDKIKGNLMTNLTSSTGSSRRAKMYSDDMSQKEEIEFLLKRL